MRRTIAIGVGVAVLLLAVGVGVWRAQGDDDKPAVEGEPDGVKAPIAEFKPVEVRAQGQQQGLTLTGTVRDPSGQPISQAEVFLAASGQQSLTSVRCATCNELLLSCHAHETALVTGPMLQERRGELVAGATTRTDAQGKFRFERLLGISFTVWARAPSFGDGVKDRAAPGDPVELYLPALRSIVGRLRDEDGQPVQGTVRAVSRRLARYVEASADVEGRFELKGLGEGPFYVHASAPGKLPAARGQVEAGPDPVTLSLISARRLEVRLLSQGKPIDGTVRVTGDHLTRELPAKGGLAVAGGLYPGSVMVSAVAGALSSVPLPVSLDSLVTQVTLVLDRGGTVAVTVLDESAQPVPGPTVELLSESGDQLAKKKLGTGELGVLGPVGAGEYHVRATADGYGTTTVPAVVKQGETAVEVTLSRGTVIAGRVIDEYGRPAPGVSVLVTPTGDSVLADAEGRFHAEVPSPGLYTLHAHHSDWGGGEVKVTAPKTDVELQLEPRAGAEITVTSDGRRVEGAHVVLFHSNGNFRSDRPSGADGVVLMRGLPADSYILVATHSDFLPSDRQTLKLEDGQLLKVAAELKVGAAVTGQVVDQLGTPVAAVSVNVMPRGAEPAQTDATGHFSIGPLKPKGVYTVRVLQRGFDHSERVLATAGGDPVKVTVRRQPLFKGRVLADGQPLKHFRVDEYEVNSPDGRFELALPSTEERVILSIESPGFEPFMGDRPNTPDLGDFSLVRTPQLNGVVRDEAGVAIPDAVVSCDTCEQSVLTGPDGRFFLSKPPFQREFTVVAKKGRRTATKSVEADASAGVELVLRPGVQLSGTAYLLSGQPAAGVEIAGLHVDRSEPISVVTNADGTYAMEVPPGVYRFMLAAPGFQNVAVDPPAIITELTGTQARLDFGPVPGLASLSVRLLPEPGYALWLVRGSVTSVGNPPLELLRTGYAQLVYQPRVERVTFGALQPGRYTLVWASFHAQSAAPPVLLPVDVPAQPEVSLVR